MKKTFPFQKMVAAGNDFILVDARKNPFGADRAPRRARAWCDRRRGIGADGLLLVLPSKRHDARMRIFNPDGSEASMCGNGLRCVAWYLYSVNGKSGPLSIETGAGTLEAERVGKERIRLFLPPPQRLRLHLKLLVAGRRLTLHAVDTGVPHAVVFVERLDQMDLASFGPALRNHRFFKPTGTNVNLVRIDSKHRIAIRTYERGVEAETLACGTGAAASGVVSMALGHVQPPVQVQTASGQFLTVGCPTVLGGVQRLSLEGPAQILFQGEIRS